MLDDEGELVDFDATVVEEGFAAGEFGQPPEFCRGCGDLARDFSRFSGEVGALLWRGIVAIFVREEGLPLRGYSGVLPLGGLREDGPELVGSVLYGDFCHDEWDLCRRELSVYERKGYEGSDTEALG